MKRFLQREFLIYIATYWSSTVLSTPSYWAQHREVLICTFFHFSLYTGRHKFHSLYEKWYQIRCWMSNVSSFSLTYTGRKQKYGYCLLSGWLCKTELSWKNFCLTLNKTGELTKYQLWQRLYCFAMRESSGIKCSVLLTQTVECDLCNSCFECDSGFSGGKKSRNPEGPGMVKQAC